VSGLSIPELHLHGGVLGTAGLGAGASPSGKVLSSISSFCSPPPGPLEQHGRSLITFIRERPQGKLCQRLNKLHLKNTGQWIHSNNCISMMISPWRNKRKCLSVDNVELHFEYLTKECTQIYRPFLTNIKLLEAALNGHKY
jgi:hypothetical protein